MEKTLQPLSFNHQYASKMWRDQIQFCCRRSPGDLAWAREQICAVVAQNTSDDTRNVLECDLLRAGGGLAKLGMQLGPYRGRDYDCDPSLFQFLNFIPYSCPVEIKKRSSGFGYQMLKYKPLPRAVVLCIEHDKVNMPEHVDVVELKVLSEYLKGLKCA